MFEFIEKHQLNMMLALCAICCFMTLMLIITRFLPKRKKTCLIVMQIVAALLVGFDRLSYLYRGQDGALAFHMVRISNFMIFLMTLGIVFSFNFFLEDMIMNELKAEKCPKRLHFVTIACIIGIILLIISHFNGFYYYFDAENNYRRGKGFLLSYVIPVVCPLIQYSVILHYRKRLTRFINIALTLYILIPLVFGIIQVKAYGISIINISLAVVSVSLYIFTYLDINDRVVRLHKKETEGLMEESSSMHRLFSQTATAFVTAAEQKDPVSQGRSEKVAEFAKMIATACGKNKEECEEVYYAALLHDVGKIALPDDLIGKDEDLSPEEEELLAQKPLISSKILSGITEYPYLADAAHYSGEHYDGSGLPDGRKGKDIPEIARIVAVADAYVDMSSRNKYRDAIPDMMIREEFIKESGGRFDPALVDIVVAYLDKKEREKPQKDLDKLEKELVCGKYRERITLGIPVVRSRTRIRFSATPIKTGEGTFSAPSVILFDSFDKRVHNNRKAIEAYHYLEYAEFWFDGHSVATNVQNLEKHESEAASGEKDKAKKKDSDPGSYLINAMRYEDHVLIRMENNGQKAEWIIALPDSSKSSYIALTGENCRISDIRQETVKEKVREEDIPRIADSVSYIQRIESDLPNVQIDRTRSAATEGVPLKDVVRLRFHSLTLPTANLVWHCPYVVIYSSADKMMNGKDYREYALIKLNGEKEGSDEYATNVFTMKRSDDFGGWESWKTVCKEGMECEIRLRRKGNRISFYSSNQGITIENTTTIKEDPENVYVAITGDQVAITDIRLL
ncbi:MAG: HD domain-containing protein [Lachnospiraceae bacterium]|nr:HD domain-containing protein [Lachnospiraceae bacterium]